MIGWGWNRKSIYVEGKVHYKLMFDFIGERSCEIERKKHENLMFNWMHNRSIWPMWSEIRKWKYILTTYKKTLALIRLEIGYWQCERKRKEKGEREGKVSTNKKKKNKVWWQKIQKTVLTLQQDGRRSCWRQRGMAASTKEKEGEEGLSKRGMYSRLTQDERNVCFKKW